MKNSLTCAPDVSRFAQHVGLSGPREQRSHARGRTQMRTSRNHSLRVLHAAIALALSQGAVAQTASPSQPAADRNDPQRGEQIVVTARRREELIQDVPGAVSAFSGPRIEQAGIQDVTGLA